MKAQEPKRKRFAIRRTRLSKGCKGKITSLIKIKAYQDMFTDIERMLELESGFQDGCKQPTADGIEKLRSLLERMKSLSPEEKEFLRRVDYMTAIPIDSSDGWIGFLAMGSKFDRCFDHIVNVLERSTMTKPPRGRSPDMELRSTIQGLVGIYELHTQEKAEVRFQGKQCPFLEFVQAIIKDVCDLDVDVGRKLVKHILSTRR